MIDQSNLRLARLGAATAALVMLAGCESVASGLYGSAATEAATPAAATTTVAEGQPVAPARVNMDPDAECPQINVPLGQSSYSSFAGESSPANYRFQARISEFARQCILNPGNTVSVRIGVQGLVILGEKGSPGTYPAPLRIAIRDRDGNTVWTASQKPSVTIPAGATQASFRIVDDTATIPISLEKPLHTYEIEVGFVQGGTPTAKKKRG